MKKKLFQFIVVAGFMMILAACGNGEVQPVAINEATDTCEICNMAVIDDHNATQLALESGRSIVFDDIGCMYEWLSENKDEEIAAEFVRDYNDKEWVLGDDATYVYNPSIKTPMAYNVISFKDKASAEEFAAKNEGSTIMTVNELADHGWVQNDDMKQEHNIKDHSHSDDAEDHQNADPH